MHIIAILVSIGLLYFLQGIVYANLWRRKLTVELHFSENRVTEGDKIILEEKLENRKWIPIPCLYVRFNFSRNLIETGGNQTNKLDSYNRNELFSILMRQRITRRVEFACTSRGVYKVNGFHVAASSLFMSEDFIQDLECNEQLIVYPARVNTNRFNNMFQTIYGEIITKQFVQENPFLYRGIREYQTYDTMKMINWGATAKTGDLKVNVLEHTSQREVSIYLNLQRETMITHSEVFEESIRLAKSFCTSLERQGMKTTLYTNGYDFETGELIQVLDNPIGRNYLDMVNEGLARIGLSDENRINTQNAEFDNDFLRIYQEQVEKESSERFLIFISNYQGDDFQKFLLHLRKISSDFHWIVPVSSSMDYHPAPQLKKISKMWRLNWEGVRRGENN